MMEQPKENKSKRIGGIRGLISRILGTKQQSPFEQPAYRRIRYPAFLSEYGFGPLADFLKIEDDLMSRYIDYEEMASSSGEICAAALDIYADDATPPSYETGKTVNVIADDAGIKNTLDEMLNDRLHIDDEIWSIARTLCMYGNAFYEIVVKENGGVCTIGHLPPPTVRVVPDEYGAVLGYMQTFSPYRGRMSPKQFKEMLEDPERCKGTGEIVFDKWEVAHFKLGGYQRYNLYGIGVLEPARWIWRRLILLEDSVLLYRLTRAPSRYVFYVDIGDLPPTEGMAYLESIKSMYKKKKFIGPEGRLDFKYNPLSQQEDFFIPIRHGRKGTEIDVLQGPAYSYIEDIEYFRDKLLSALKIPKAYLSYTEDVNRATLSSLDVRFARTIMQIQRELRNGLEQICDAHLASFGLIPDRTKYRIELNTPSAILELAQLEIMRTRAEVASMLGELFPAQWILKNVFKLNDEEVDFIVKELSSFGPSVEAVPPEEISPEEIPPEEVPPEEFPPEAVPPEQVRFRGTRRRERRGRRGRREGEVVVGPEGRPSVISSLEKGRKAFDQILEGKFSKNGNIVKQLQMIISQNRQLSRDINITRKFLQDLIMSKR